MELSRNEKIALCAFALTQIGKTKGKTKGKSAGKKGLRAEREMIEYGNWTPELKDIPYRDRKRTSETPEADVGPSSTVYPLVCKQRAASKRLQMAGINKNPDELTLPQANLLLSREPLRISFKGQTHKLKPLSGSELKALLYSSESATQIVARLLD